ncbi:class I SAM-dependent methyltransferase [Gordonia caeni]|uniref:class I SAM-dependent methyltransferase n=1 Tax=Gordonia caeni TaxID=1007097 RepID=UPI0031DA6FF9
MDLTALERFPDIDGPGLAAADAADRLLLDVAADALSHTPPGKLVVVDDAYGALTLGAAAAGAREIRVHQDLLTGERALAANAARLGDPATFTSLPLDGELFAGAATVLLRLPRGLDRLAEMAELIAAYADADVRVFAGGRIKHMSLSMNDVLGAAFDRVDVSHARQKSRVLTASGPRRDQAREAIGRWPRREQHADLALEVAAHGGVFAGTRIDLGTRLLLEHLDATGETATAVDLACGSGVVAAALARRRPGVQVVATDRSAAAVASARQTAAANGVADRVTVVRADGAGTLPDASQELVLLNPPFHSDTAVSTGIAEHLFAEAARALAPGGELWCVWNSHLRYRPVLERLVGPTRQIARNPKFTVTASRRR